MGKEIIAIVAEGCPGCHELIEKLKQSNQTIKILDVTKSLEAARIVRDLGIDRVPTLISVEKSETGTTFCTMDKKEPRCVRGSEASQ